MPRVKIKVKLPTATVRLLSIDGGGVRGIIPLVFLQVLEERIGLLYPVQGNFHFTIGTSSGESNQRYTNADSSADSVRRGDYRPWFVL
jgi:patatin-like phospholipase/acyl hydrolase